MEIMEKLGWLATILFFTCMTGYACMGFLKLLREEADKGYGLSDEKVAQALANSINRGADSLIEHWFGATLALAVLVLTWWFADVSFFCALGYALTTFFVVSTAVPAVLKSMRSPASTTPSVQQEPSKT